ncbi:MAG TPA: ABC transporter permease subunit [Acidimicrobiales bacterium]
MIRAARRIWLVARHDLLDLARQRGTWLSLLMFPVINVSLLVLVPGFLSEREQNQQDTVRYVVAAEGETADVASLRPLLEGARFTVQESEDATAAVKSRDAHVGLVLEPGAAAALEGEGQAKAKVIALSTRRSANLAFGRLVGVLDALRTSVARERIDDRNLPARVARPLDVTPVDLADTRRGAQLQFSLLLPLLMLLPLTGAVAIAAQRISGGKDQRVIEPLLVLPVSRTTVLAGKAVSGLVLGAVTLPAVVLPLFIGRVFPVGGSGRTVALGIDTIAAVTAIAVLLLAFLVALGSFAGAASRTSTEMASMLPFVTMPVILLAVSLQFFAGVRTTIAFALLPAVGPALLVRDVGAGIVAGVPAVVVALATIAWTVVLLVLAGRFLERERSVLRPTT